MDFSKLDGLIPAVVQDERSGEVLMVGFMNQEALDRTHRDRVRDVLQPHARQLWTKGKRPATACRSRRRSSTVTRTPCC